MTNNTIRKPAPGGLSKAVEDNDIKAVEGIFRCGANANGQGDEGVPLRSAAGRGYVEIARLLIANGADVNKRSRFFGKFTPLMVAASKGHIEMARLLIDNKADINAADDDGVTALMYSAMNGSIEVTRLLIEKGADTSIMERHDNKTAQRLADDYDHENVAQLLENAPQIRRRYAEAEARAKAEAVVKAAHAIATKRQDRLKSLMSKTRRPQP